RVVRLLLLLLGLAVLALLVRRAGLAVVVGMLRRVGWGFVAACVLYTAQLCIRALALWRTLEPPLRYVDVLLVRLSAESVAMLTFTGPFLAEPAKGWLLTRRGIDSSIAFGGVLTEYLLYITTSAVLSIVALSSLISRHALPPGPETTLEVVLLLTV